MKGKAFRKNSLHEKPAASVLLKPFISRNEWSLCRIKAIWYLPLKLIAITGDKQSVAGCDSQRRHCSCYSTKTYVNSVILILKLNLTSIRNIYIKSGLRWDPQPVTHCLNSVAMPLLCFMHMPLVRFGCIIF